MTLLIDGSNVNCFISYCPYEIQAGKIDDVELYINPPDNYGVRRSETSDVLIEKSHGYSYFLYGKLCDNTFQTFTVLSNQDIHHDHPDLNNHFIKLEVERVDVSFH